jgi:hypothetical protein
MKHSSWTFIVAVAVWSTALLAVGCKPTTTPNADHSRLAFSSVDASNKSRPFSSSKTTVSTPPSLKFVVPEHVSNVLKRKCYICHGGAEVKGGFDFKKMVYQSDSEPNWQPMDLAGVTRIKLAILPLNGKPARMPRRAGSIWNPLTVEEANAVAKWTDYPYER